MLIVISGYARRNLTNSKPKSTELEEATRKSWSRLVIKLLRTNHYLNLKSLACDTIGRKLSH